MVTFSLHAALCALLSSLCAGNGPIFAHALTRKLRSARLTSHGDSIHGSPPAYQANPPPAVSRKQRSIGSRLGAAGALQDKFRTSLCRFDRRLVRVRYNFLDGRQETLPPLPANTRVQMLLDIVRKDGTHCFANDVRGLGVGRAALFLQGNEEPLEPHLTLAHCLLAGAAGGHVEREDASRAPFGAGARNHPSVADGSSAEGAACEQNGTTELNVFVTPVFYNLPAWVDEARVDVCHCRDRPLVVHTRDSDSQQHGDLKYKLARDERATFPNHAINRCGLAVCWCDLWGRNQHFRKHYENPAQWTFSFDEREWSARASPVEVFRWKRKAHWDDTVVRFDDHHLRVMFYSTKHRKPVTLWCADQEEYAKYRVLFPKLASKATGVDEAWGLRGPL